jgi:ATP synthase protein I
VALLDEGRPLRTVLRWQVYATAASMSIAVFWMGFHGACSALLGGLVNITAGAVFGWAARRRRKSSLGEAFVSLMRAEAAKVTLIVVQLGMVLALYKQLVPVAFFGTFILTVIFFSMAIFIRDR